MVIGLSAHRSRSSRQSLRDGERKLRDDSCEQERNTESVIRQAVLVITFTPLSDSEESESETNLASLDEQDLWYATEDKAEV